MTKNMKWMAIMIATMITMGIFMASCGSDEPKNSKDVTQMLIGTWQSEDTTNGFTQTLKFTKTRFTFTNTTSIASYDFSYSGVYKVVQDEGNNYVINMQFDDGSDITALSLHIYEITSKKLVLDYNLTFYKK